MKIKLLPFLPFSLSVFFMLSAAFAKTEIPNGDMSDGGDSPAGWGELWQANTETSEPVKLIRDTEDFVNEPASLKLVVPEGAGSASTRLTVTQNAEQGLPAETITFRGQIKLDADATGNAIVSVEGVGTDWQRAMWENLTVVMKSNGQWTPFEKEITLPRGLKRINLVLTVSNGVSENRISEISSGSLRACIYSLIAPPTRKCESARSSTSPIQSASAAYCWRILSKFLSTASRTREA